MTRTKRINFKQIGTKAVAFLLAMITFLSVFTFYHKIKSKASILYFFQKILTLSISIDKIRQNRLILLKFTIDNRREFSYNILYIVTLE